MTMSKTTVLVTVGSVVLSVAALFGGVLVGDAMSHDVEPASPRPTLLPLPRRLPRRLRRGATVQIGAGAAGGGAEAAGSSRRAPRCCGRGRRRRHDPWWLSRAHGDDRSGTTGRRRRIRRGAVLPPVPEERSTRPRSARRPHWRHRRHLRAVGPRQQRLGPRQRRLDRGRLGRLGRCRGSSGDAGGADGEMAVIDPIFDMGDTPQIRFFDSCADGADDCPDGVGGTLLSPGWERVSPRTCSPISHRSRTTTTTDARRAPLAHQL